MLYYKTMYNLQTQFKDDLAKHIAGYLSDKVLMTHLAWPGTSLELDKLARLLSSKEDHPKNDRHLL